MESSTEMKTEMETGVLEKEAEKGRETKRNVTVVAL